MATKRIAPLSGLLPDFKTVKFSDGERTLAIWELAHANDDDAFKYAHRLLSEMTYSEWLNEVQAKAGLSDYLTARKSNTKLQVSRGGF